MNPLTDVTVEELRRTLDAIDEKTPAMRLIAAIAYKNGVTQSELAEWFGVTRKTIYNWFTRFERGELDSAVRDDHRPGRPRKLTAEQLDTLEGVLGAPPSEVGVDMPAWTTQRLQAFIRDRFDIDYSRPTCRRLMRDAGLRHQKPRKADTTAPDGRDHPGPAVETLDHPWISK